MQSMFFMRERDADSYVQFRFIDEINPAFRRLQRWLRRTARRLISTRQQRQLAFMMSAHARLGAGSLLATLDVDTMRAVLILK